MNNSKVYLFVLIFGMLLMTGCANNVEINYLSGEYITSGDYIEITSTKELVPKESNLPYYFSGDILHGITIEKSDLYSSISGEIVITTLEAQSNIDILKDENEYYFVKYKDQTGYVKRDFVRYFIFDKNSELVLACDVSGFNYNREFKTKEEFETYLLINNFNYAIIRLGGRGYGKAGNMYYDDKVQIFVDACEYLGIPYGFYFLDEAVNLDEAHQEFEFIMEKYKAYNGRFNVLPLAIDVENQHGDGRADSIWSERISYLNSLIDELKNQKIDCMVYANGARIETFFIDLNCVYWTAMYTLDDKIPKVFYDEFIKNEEKKIIEDYSYLENSILNVEPNKGDTNTIWYSDDYLNRVVAWQFTENGANLDSIKGSLDLDLMKNYFFLKYCTKIYK